MDFTPSSELCDLIDAACDDELTPQTLARLEEILAADDEARAYYVQCLQAQALLERYDAARGDHGDLPPARPLGRVARFFARPTPFSITAAVVVIVGVLAGLALVAVPNYRKHITGMDDQTSSPVVARVTGMNNAQWEGGQIGDGRPATLTDGQSLSLLRGLVEIEFNSGATVVLQGPARCRIEGVNAMHLEAGRLAARVSPQARGFRVATGLATFVDLGTEFTVAVQPGQLASLFVHQGQVSFQRAASDTPVVLAAGHGVEIHSDGRAATVTTEPATLAAVRGGVQRENLLVNGSFEANAAPLDEPLPRDPSDDSQFGWRSVGEHPAVVRAAALGGEPLAGERFVQLQGHPNAGAALEQTIVTAPGTQYQVTYHVARVGSGEKWPTLAVDAIPAGAAGDGDSSLLHAEDVIDWPLRQWRPRRYWFVATSDETVLRFSEPSSSNSNSVAPLLDHVSVIVSPSWREEEDRNLHSPWEDATGSVPEDGD